MVLGDRIQVPVLSYLVIIFLVQRSFTKKIRWIKFYRYRIINGELTNGDNVFNYLRGKVNITKN